MESFGNNCRDLRLRDVKDILKIVLERKRVRGGSITTRLGTLVILSVDSCPGVLAKVGMNVRGRGCGDCLKGGIW